MGHGLFKRDRQYGLVQAWHNLTDVVEKITKELFCPYEVIFAGLGYYGKPAPDEKTKFIRLEGTHEVTGKQFDWVIPIASDDMQPLGFSTPINLKTYTVECPRMAWDFLEGEDGILKGTGHTIVSALTVQNRSKWAIGAQLNEIGSIALNDGDTIDLYLNSMGSLDKSLKKKLCISTIRPVCYNTIMANFLEEQTVGKIRQALNAPHLFPGVHEKTKLEWNYRHSKKMAEYVKADRPVIEQFAGMSQVIKLTFDMCLSRPCTVDRAEAIYAGLIAKPEDEELSTRAANMVEQHVQCFQTGDGNRGQTESDLLNGWTQPRTRGYEESKKEKWETFESSELGEYGKSKSRFAGMLTFDREELGKVEERGRSLVTARRSGTVAVS